MAFTEAQYKNFIKVIVVAAVAKEFRKSAIMEKIYNKIKNNKPFPIVATGELLAFRHQRLSYQQEMIDSLWTKVVYL